MYSVRAIGLIVLLRQRPALVEPAGDDMAGGMQHLLATWAVIPP